jgi:hypothetical protein
MSPMAPRRTTRRRKLDCVSNALINFSGVSGASGVSGVGGVARRRPIGRRKLVTVSVQPHSFFTPLKFPHVNCLIPAPRCEVVPFYADFDW